ncbi:MAG: twin-arginine translocation pathway signal protein [Bryobacterales bacterium]|nr:twin-arginine translocation pathway signal protein [Bryobacterales bacterium]
MKHRMLRRHFVTTVATAALAPAFQGKLPSGADRAFLGPDYWSNPMQDWRLRDGRIECIVAGGDRNVCLLTREASARIGDLKMTVRLGPGHAAALDDGFAGFRFGIRGRFADYRDSAVRGFGVNAGVTAQGRLFIGDPGAGPLLSGWPQEVALHLEARPGNAGNYRIAITARDASGQILATHARDDAAPEWLTGLVALVASSGPVRPTPEPFPPMVPNGGAKPGTARGGTMRFWFRDWQVSGSKLDVHPERAWGPLYFSMHTLSRGVVKLTAQLADVTGQAALQLRDGSGWKTIASAPIDPLSSTARFRVRNWDDTRDHSYRIAFSLPGEGDFFHQGTIRRDPRHKPNLTIGALTCNNDFGFPHREIVHALEHFQPDVLLFTGDQIYERVCEYGIQMAPLDAAALDYLRKWLLFGWSYRDLMRDIPTVAIPDDHDVYHGNVWGEGGKRALPLEQQAEKVPVATHPNKAWQDDGGYKMPPAWVNAVQRTQTSHLPDPPDPTPTGEGVDVYFTSLLYGGVDFAILEDRKWKSAPARAVPEARIENGWVQNPAYDPARAPDPPRAELMGPRQLAFLDQWAADWEGVLLKCAVSQTIFCNLATLPPPANTDDVTSKLPTLKLDEYPEGEVPVADHDSNGWPRSGRNAAVRALRKAQAFHIGGDQHLGSMVQYGLDDWNDAAFALCTPAISNLFPRRWYPPRTGANCPEDAPRNCGEYLDGFGNRMTVHAVANPAQFGAEPAILYNRAPGYGIIHIERATRKITLTNWPRWVDPSQTGALPFPGWPKTIHPFDNGLSGAKWTLGRLEAPGMRNPVVEVVNEATGKIEYTVRADGSAFEAGVWSGGRYTVRFREGKKDKAYRGLEARAKG